MIAEGETTSSAGSEQAPSEDNLEPEQIDQVVPIIEEDPKLKKAKKKKDQLNKEET